MLRVHFTPADLTGVTLAPGISDTWEMLLSARQLQSCEAHRQFGDWRARVRRSGLPDPVVEQLGGCLSPMPHPVPQGRPEVCLEEALDRYWQHALSPYWSALQRRVAADVQERAHQQAIGGLSVMLENLCRGAVWQQLELQVPGPTGEMHLEGDGLLLQPAYFCPPSRTIFVQTPERPVLICPVTHDPHVLAPGSAGSADADLGRLIGPARAEVLRATQVPGTTSELAIRLGTSVSTVSRHASALAAAQLITSSRHGQGVTHAISSLGIELLGGAHFRGGAQLEEVCVSMQRLAPAT